MSDSLESLCLVVLLIAAPLLVALFVRVGRRPYDRLRDVVRGRWNARIRQGFLFRGDRIEIRVDEIPGEITYGEVTGKASSRSPSGWTRVRFNWPSDRRLRVAPEGFASRLRRLFGGADVHFDDPPFDDRFWVESSHPTWARSLLDPAARRGLVRLRLHPVVSGSNEVTLDLGPSGLSLRVSSVLLDDAAALGTLVELSISILQRARGLVEAAGVVLEPVTARRGSTCPVCGHGIEDGALACPSCRTPHHRECWSYFGGCAIFGCRTRARRSA